jgi:hypothetical protein
MYLLSQCGVSVNELELCTGAQINFGDLTPYLTYGITSPDIQKYLENNLKRPHNRIDFLNRQLKEVDCFPKIERCIHTKVNFWEIIDQKPNS